MPDSVHGPYAQLFMAVSVCIVVYMLKVVWDVCMLNMFMCPATQGVCCMHVTGLMLNISWALVLDVSQALCSTNGSCLFRGVRLNSGCRTV